MTAVIVPYGEDIDNGITASDVYHSRIIERNKKADEIRSLRNSYFKCDPRKPIYENFNKLIRTWINTAYTAKKPTKENLLKEGNNILASYSHAVCPYNICGQDDAWYEGRAWNIAHALACIQAAYEFAKDR